VFCENPEWGATDVERAEAERCYTLDGNNDIEIDDCPQVRRGDDGVWVAAWVWLPRSAAPHSQSHLDTSRSAGLASARCTQLRSNRLAEHTLVPAIRLP
jgi:hypothetical protein